jgi:uncharacterized protein (TIGR00255 family)
MTGFASVGREGAGQRVNVTLKSVNHRFLDVLVRAPAALGSLDGRVRALVQERLTRGRVEATLSLDLTSPPPRDVVLDETLLARVTEILENARARGLVAGGLTASDVVRIPQILEIRPRTVEAGVPEPVAALAERAIGAAVDALAVMRETEGRFLAADLAARLTGLAALLDEIEGAARAGQSELEARLRQRLAELPPDVAGDPSAIAQEIVRVVARSDVDEEFVRLRGHIGHWRTLADGPEPCGRKLDFLVQEMNREVNTIGAKAEGGRVTELVITAKAELERLREQVQNVE